jgi:hypothetical protein
MALARDKFTHAPITRSVPTSSIKIHNTSSWMKNQKCSPPLYFSNKIAVDLYTCLKGACNLPAMDENYPKTLPFDFCLI